MNRETTTPAQPDSGEPSGTLPTPATHPTSTTSDSSQAAIRRAQRHVRALEAGWAQYED